MTGFEKCFTFCMVHMDVLCNIMAKIRSGFSYLMALETGCAWLVSACQFYKHY